MRIKSINAVNIEPIKSFSVDHLSDVVVLAGRNGVGKSRLIRWLLTFFQSGPSNVNQWLEVEATNAEEMETWKKTTLDTRVLEDAAKLRAYLQKSRRRSGKVSTVLNFESNRTIAQIKPFAFTWDYADPFEELVAWNDGFTDLTNRFTDTVHSIFRKIRSRREAIAAKVEQMIRKQTHAGQGTPSKIELDPNAFPDPMIPFKEAFAQLLSPKRLVDPDITKQELFFVDEKGKEFPIASLSSGEREVVNVVFDFLLRRPSDCIVFFDEPELHLHPELSYKLLQTLRNVGSRNQFIFCTHSAEIISASLDYSVVFVSPPRPDESNQAIVVREDDATHRALKLLGQSIGIVSLGKKVVLIEGEHGSLDKQTYGAILKGRFPSLVLVPSGGKGLIRSFDTILERVIEKSIWGVQFFMLCDRDAVPSGTDTNAFEQAANGRVKVLRRYHIENYFLDSNIIADIFRPFEPSNSWRCDPVQVDARLLDIARSRLSHTTALIVAAHFREIAGNVSILPKECDNKSLDELIALLKSSVSKEHSRLTGLLAEKEIESFASKIYKGLEVDLSNGAWRNTMPGRPILNIFCSMKHANFDFGRLKVAYLRVASIAKSNPFEDIDQIFAAFDSN